MSVVTSSLEKLRGDFDGAFALPTRVHAPDTVDLLLVSSGSLRVALLVDGLSAIHRGKVVVSLPSRVHSFRGVCNLGGHLSSVYDLGSLLGAALLQAPADCHETGGHDALLVLKRPSIALAVDSMERYLRVEKSNSLLSSGEQHLTVDVVLEPYGAVHLLQFPALARAIEESSPGEEK